MHYYTLLVKNNYTLYFTLYLYICSVYGLYINPKSVPYFLILNAHDLSYPIDYAKFPIFVDIQDLADLGREYSDVFVETLR